MIFPFLNAGHVSSLEGRCLKTTTQHRYFISGNFSSSIRTSHIKNHYALRKLPLTVEWCKFPGVNSGKTAGKILPNAMNYNWSLEFMVPNFLEENIE